MCDLPKHKEYWHHRSSTLKTKTRQLRLNKLDTWRQPLWSDCHSYVSPRRRWCRTTRGRTGVAQRRTVWRINACPSWGLNCFQHTIFLFWIKATDFCSRLNNANSKFVWIKAKYFCSRLTLVLHQKWNYEMKPHFYFQNTFRGPLLTHFVKFRVV